MVELTHYNKSLATFVSTANTTMTQAVAFTVNWSDLTTAGFAADDVVHIIWNWTAGAEDTTLHTIFDLASGASFGARTSIRPTDFRVECMDANESIGGVKCGWVEVGWTLVANDNFYIAQRLSSFTASPDASWLDDFSVTFIKEADLASGDVRTAEHDTPIAVDTDFANGRGAQVTLPASPTGDDWLIIACGDWDLNGTTVGIKQRINVDGVATYMETQREPESDLEQIPLMTVGVVSAAAASQTVTLEAAEQTAAGPNTIDASRILALRLQAFESHAFSRGTSTTAMSNTTQVFVQAATISLVLDTTGPVFVIAEAIADQTSGTNVTADPYIRIQDGGTDIITDLGRATDHFRDDDDRTGVTGHLVADMTAATRTIDLDMARREAADINHQITDYCLVAFSMELAGATSSPIPAFMNYYRQRRQ
jgi:hypothetical protein